MLTVLQLARICHEVNRIYCQSIGDGTQEHWDDAPIWQQESSIRGVEFALANPGALPSAQHEAWLASKQSEGWTYGAIKCSTRKTHPCFVPYDDLPQAQRRKDEFFLAVVRAYLAGELQQNMLDNTQQTR